MGAYDSIAIPVKGQPISSGAYGIPVRDAILDLDRRVSASDSSSGTGRASATSSLVLTTTTETTGLVVTGMTFKSGLAYMATMRCGINSATAGTVGNFRLRKGTSATPASLTDYGEFFRFEGKGAVGVMNGLGSIYLLNPSLADVTQDVTLSVQSSVAGANAFMSYANGNSARFLTITPIGFATDFAGMGISVTP